MEQNNFIQDQVKATMESIEGISKAGPRPFFYSRLHARMHRSTKNIWDELVVFLARPAVALAIILLVIFVNTTAILQEQEFVSEQANEMTVSDEYAIASNSYSDYVNQEPE